MPLPDFPDLSEPLLDDEELAELRAMTKTVIVTACDAFDDEVCAAVARLIVRMRDALIDAGVPAETAIALAAQTGSGIAGAGSKGATSS